MHAANEQQQRRQHSAKATGGLSRASSGEGGRQPSRPASGQLSRTHSASQQKANASEQEANEQVQRLKEKYVQLESEAKAHTAALQESVKQSRRVWVALSKQHDELQAQMASRGAAALEQSGKPQADRLVAVLEKEVHALRRQCDKVLQDKKTVVAKLEHLQDAVRQVSREGGGPQAPAPSPGVGGQEARQMRQLENRLDKATLKANEAHSIRLTYEQVLRRMQQEQLTFDPHVKALEAVVKAKAAELVQAQQRHRDLQRQKAAAKQELTALDEQVASNRAQRAAQLQAQRAAVQSLGDANQALLARHMQAAAAAGVAKGGAILGQNLAAQGEAEPASTSNVAVKSAEETMAALCAALSCHSAEAACKRLLSLQSTLQGLQDMKQAATHQVAMLNTQLEAARMAVDQLQSGARQCSTQAALDAVQAELREAQSQADTAKAAHDKVQRVYVDVKAGLQHLSAMVAPLPLPPGHIPVPLSDDTLGDVLAQCQQRLMACQAFIHTIPKAAELLDGMMQNPDLCFGPAPEEAAPAPP